MAIVDQNDRHLKWHLLDWLEAVLIVACGMLLAVFTVATLVNVLTRLQNLPILWLNELILGAFVWGIFLGASVAVRRNQHFRIASFTDRLPRYWHLASETVIQLVVLACAGCLAVFGYENFLQGFRNYLETTGTPIATITASLPVFGALVMIFSLERLVNVWRVAFSPSGFEKHSAPYALGDEGSI